MNPAEPSKNSSLSEDLTVILLRGNGSPRTFRLSLPALQRSLTALGFLFAFSIVAAVGLLIMSIVRAPSAPVTVEKHVAVEAPADTGGEAKPAFWKKLTGTSTLGAAEETELQKEVNGLREDISKLSALADARKNLPAGQAPGGGLIQFFGPRNVEETSSPISVKNVRVRGGEAGSKDLFVDFELHNTDPEQRQARGYIVVMAKTPGFIATYPEGAFSPSQNILLDYTKGETFAVSRFREARANFPAAQLEGKKPRFQVLLFSTDGKVIANTHVEGER